MFDMKETEYKNFGKCLYMTNGVINLVVTLDEGPRIVKFSHTDFENILFNDEGRIYQQTDSEYVDYWGNDSVFYDYGGHRLELVPRIWPNTFYPDNEAVTYTKTESGVKFFIPANPDDKVYLSFEISMGNDTNNVMIIHNLKNISNEAKIISLSGVTQLAPGGMMIVPQNKVQDKNELNPNRAFSLWDYSRLTDKRVEFFRNYITLKHDPDISRRFKIGFNNCSSYAVYKNGKNLFIKSYVHNKKARYPDFNSSFEAYVDQNMLQLNTLSSLYDVEPQEKICHIENWSLSRCENEKLPQNIEEIEELMENI